MSLRRASLRHVLVGLGFALWRRSRAVSAVLVPAQPSQHLVVAFGDSITDGDGSTMEADRNWPGDLIRRLAKTPKSAKLAIVNEGIAGNRLLANGPLAGFGVSALARFGSTMTPFEGVTIIGYYSSAKEAARQAVNKWIRNSGAFDGVIDFDAVLRDPNHPGRLLPRFSSEDHIHPNDAGYQAMADAINLALFQ